MYEKSKIKIEAVGRNDLPHIELINAIILGDILSFKHCKQLLPQRFLVIPTPKHLHKKVNLLNINNLPLQKELQPQLKFPHFAHITKSQNLQNNSFRMNKLRGFEEQT